MADVLDEGSSDVVIATRDEYARAWTNFGVPLPAWPKFLDARVEVSAATGDIDGDGIIDVVFASTTPPQLIVLDMGAAVDRNPANQTWWWPMYAYNPMRQGCLACDAETQVSAVPEAPAPPPRFLLPAPNPSGAPVTLRFELTEASSVRVTVFDVSGRVIRRLLDADRPAGRHTVQWDGLTDNGRPAAAGVHYVRLAAESAAGAFLESHKVTLVR